MRYVIVNYMIIIVNWFSMISNWKWNLRLMYRESESQKLSSLLESYLPWFCCLSHHQNFGISGSSIWNEYHCLPGALYYKMHIIMYIVHNILQQILELMNKTFGKLLYFFCLFEIIEVIIFFRFFFACRYDDYVRVGFK